jgi:hypothetical protein
MAVVSIGVLRRSCRNPTGTPSSAPSSSTGGLALASTHPGTSSRCSQALAQVADHEVDVGRESMARVQRAHAATHGDGVADLAVGLGAGAHDVLERRWNARLESRHARRIGWWSHGRQRDDVATRPGNRLELLR